MKSLLLLGLLLAQTAGAAGITVLGITIGADLSAIPKCDEQQDPKDGVWKILNTCLARNNDDTKKSEWGATSYNVRLPEPDLPSYIDRIGETEVIVYAIDAKVEGLEFFTKGAGVQDDALAALKKKFGKPQALKTQRLQNAFGAAIIAYDATWLKEDLRVTFSGIDGRADIGSVHLMSKKFDETYEKWEAKHKQRDL